MKNFTFRLHKLHFIFFILIFWGAVLNAQNPWNGQVTANYNVCDGSVTFSTFVFEDCPSCTDWAVGNLVIQYRDEQGIYRRLAIVRMLKAMTAGGNRIPYWDNSDEWRGDGGAIINQSNVPAFDDSRALNALNEGTNSFGFVYSTKASYALCPAAGCNASNTAGSVSYGTGAAVEPIFEPSLTTIGNKSYLNLKWKNPPLFVRNSASMTYKMPLAITVNHDGNLRDITGFGSNVPEYTNTITIDQLKTVTGLTATINTNCNNVKLSWSEIQDNCVSSSYKIYRDGNFLSEISTFFYADSTLIPAYTYYWFGIPLFTIPAYWSYSNQTFRDGFFDNAPIKGQEHKYKLALNHLGADNVKFQGTMSSEVTGKVKSPPEKPFGLSATDNKCNQTIELSWNINLSAVNATPHTAFRIERAIDSGFNSGLTTFDDIAPGARTYVDESVSKNVKYYYRIQSKNGCSNNSFDLSGVSNTAKGVAPGDPPKVARVSSSPQPFNRILIQWNDSTEFEEKYIVSRSLLTGGGTTDFTVDKNSTSFVDSLAQICVDYVYKIKSTSVCNTNGIESQALAQIRLDAILNNTFDIPTRKILKTSKGYFPNRVELNWTNNNSASVTGWKIYRKNMSSPNGDSVLIASPTASTGQYLDYTTDANVFYKYTIIGEALCGTVTLTTNKSEDIGFRYPSGTISGNIVYEGGITVKNAKVTAQTSSGASGYSLNFNGDVNSGAKILKSNILNSNSPFTIEFWMKPTTLITNAVLVKKSDYTGNTHYAVEYNQSTNQIDFWYQSNNGAIQKVSSSFGLATGQYTHVTAVKEANALKLYKNGDLLNSFTTTVAQTTFPDVNINIGTNANNTVKFNGNLDELRIYKKAKTAEQISQDYSRYINPEDNDLVAYFPLDENINSFSAAYDLSKSNNAFNENILVFDPGVSFSSSIPNASQLNNIGYTDVNGFYIINACKYNSTGQNFTVTPSFGTHSFLPASKVEFIGEGSTIKSNVDFVDKSSFTFNGKVLYANCTCPMEGGVVYIDDAAVIIAGEIKKTDEDGKFTINVPIGEHFVSVKYPNHTFSVGRFPAGAGTLFNFQANVAGEYQYVDNTLRKVLGRVVGGQEEAKKALGFGRSKNNIGKAKIVFKSVKLDGCYKDTIYTNDTSGEYTTYLPPIKFTIADLKIASNAGISFNNSDGIGKVVDLNFAFENKKIVDTLFRNIINSSGQTIKQLVRIDSTTYNDIFSYMHRNNISISLKGIHETNPTTKDSFFIGEKNLVIDSTTVSLVPFDPLNNATAMMKYPVFKTNSTYTARFDFTENFTNYDYAIPLVSKYPVSGVLGINSYLGSGSGSYNIDSTGSFVWTFFAGTPNLALDNINPQYNYTNPMQIVFNSPGAASVEYLPYSNDPVSKVYRGFILGGRSHGNNFVTKDIDKVEFVLRDPPGTNSFATWSKNSKATKKKYSSKDESYGGNVETEFKTGAAVETYAGGGFGAIVLTQTTNTIAQFSAGASANYTYSNVSGSSLTEEIENLESISTSSAADQVGHNADVFIGYGKNVIFGKTLNLIFVDTSQCGLDGITCTDSRVGRFALAQKNVISIGEGLAYTKFHFTTQEIEEIVIPNLEQLRNDLFTQYPTVYVNKLTAADKETGKYGSNNDDPIWGTAVSSPKPFVDDAKDTSGLSYDFHAYKVTSGVDSIWYFDSLNVKRWIKTKSVDKVRNYNKAIRQWKIELAKNEREKYIAFTDVNGTGLDNISMGTAIIQKTYTSSSDKENVVESNHTLAAEVKLGFTGDVTIFGVTLGNETSASFTTEQKWTNGTQENNFKSNTFDYVLQDENQGDLMNLLVKNPKDGGGHLFKVLAGQTSCPYQDEARVKWYDPDNSDRSDNFKYIFASTLPQTMGKKFSEATVQLDIPQIVIAQPSLYNVPSDEPAVYNMVLSNVSSVTSSRDFDLRVNLASNPYGAIVKVDGLDPNRTFSGIPSGTGINKVITIEKGPNRFNYDSIMIIFTTNCDVDKSVLADTAYISVHFIPACTKATILTPDNQWVANNFTGDTLPIIINDYNYNFNGFSNIQLKYKKSTASTWITEETFHYDTTGLNNPNAKLIPRDRSFIDYKWNIKDNVDGPYDVRLDVRCDFPSYPNIIREIPKINGIIDKINPVPFGTPSPADGILDPNDDISIQFNEPLDNGTLTYSNFDIRGVLNETPIRNSTSLYFNGTTNYMEVPGDINLQQRDFTIETWVKRAENGRKQTLFSQGSDANQAIEIGIDADGKIYYRVGSGINNELIKSDFSITDLNDWHHFAMSYNHANEEVQMYWDGTYVNQSSVHSMYTDNLATGKIQIGKNLSGNNQHFKGNLHEIRVWNKFRTLAEIVATMNKTVNRSNPGTLFNWRLDEAEGNLAKDDIRERDAVIHGATWMVDPSSKSIALNGTNQYVRLESGNYGITKEMDMTLEFWFNSAQTSPATLVSNGKGYLHTDSITAWNIEKDAAGKIHVKNNNYDWVVTDSNYFDGQWHHFALVLNRKASTIVYIDGNQQKTVSSEKFAQFGGGNIYLGALGYYNGSLFDSTNFLNGNIDEFRFWNSARLIEQIKRDKRNRLKGDEYGLLSYTPFEEYVEVSGVPSLVNSMKDIADTSHDVTPMNGASHSAMTTAIKLPRAVQSIQFNYVLNNDKIILTPTTAAKFIENVTLDVTVKNVKDKNGNIQQSPKTWIAYIDKNQVVWGNDQFSIDKKLNDPYTINTTIANKGGATKSFTIDNVPSWMTVTPTSGVIAPNSVLPVTVVINSNLAIGDYENDLQLLTDFGYAEKLTIKVKCRAANPNWTVDPAKYQYSMNMIGKLKINEVISSDIEDKIAVFVGEECRGVANIQYVPAYDDYFVFLNVYSNDATGSETFINKIWDASVGVVLPEVTPNTVFESNTLRGSLTNPIIFTANNYFSQVIPVTKGWNWISLNVESNNSGQFNKLLKSLKSSNDDIVKSQTAHRVFSKTENWKGSLAIMVPDKGYMLKSNIDDTLVVDGILANPTIRLISLNTGWNWIGFNSIRNLPINQALGGLNPVNEDLIKSKSFFAVYDQRIGWIGNLSAMKPGEGYMYKSATPNSFYYPIAGYYKSGVNDPNSGNTYFDVKSDEFESNMNLIGQFDCQIINSNSLPTIGAFDKDGICRGAAKFKYVEGMDQPYIFLTLAGNAAENLSFKIYDEGAKKTFDLTEELSYEGNSIQGNMKSPFKFKLSPTLCEQINNSGLTDYYVHVYPVEFKNDFTIEFGGKVEGNVSFELFDVLGKSIAGFEKESNLKGKKFSMNSSYPQISNLSTGIYFFKVNINGAMETFKLIKQ